MIDVTEAKAPWAYVACKDGKWAGVASAEMPKKDLGKFMAEFAGDGFSIVTVHSRDEWLKLSSDMPMWRRSVNSQSGSIQVKISTRELLARAIIGAEGSGHNDPPLFDDYDEVVQSAYMQSADQVIEAIARYAGVVLPTEVEYP